MYFLLPDNPGTLIFPLNGRLRIVNGDYQHQRIIIRLKIAVCSMYYYMDPLRSVLAFWTGGQERKGVRGKGKMIRFRAPL